MAEDGKEWAYWMSNTTSPRTWASEGTKKPWVIILSSGHEIRSDRLPVWKDGWADIEDVDGRHWKVKKEAVIGWYRRRSAPTALRGYTPLEIWEGKKCIFFKRESLFQEGISLPSPCV